MIRRMLIANRGEIALRVMRTCSRLGLETVLAASEADLQSVPARITLRGAARSGSMAKPECAAAPACAFIVFRIASRPLMVCSVQDSASASRQ